MRTTAGRTLALLACAFVALPSIASARDLSDVPSDVRSGPTVASSGGHFLIHYAREGSHAVSATRARKLARLAEDAWRIEIGRWGWPAPLNDGDRRVDIYVHRMAPAGRVTPDAAGGPASAWMSVRPDYINPVLVSHELLHVSQAAIAADYQGQVLTEGLGYWAGNAATRNRFPPDWARFDRIRPFGCTGFASCVTWKWAFFQFLAERYGHRLLVDAYRRAADMTRDPEGRAAPAIHAALQARGTSIGAAHVEYVAAVTGGRFRLGVLREFRPVAAFRALLNCGKGASRTLPVEPLAARWVELHDLCVEREATLRLSVTWPGSVDGARPALSGPGEIEGLPVSRGDGRLTAAIPATALGTALTLGLPNPGGGDASFRVAVESRTRRLAKVRVLSPVRAAAGRPRAVTFRARSSRGVWLGVGLYRNALRSEAISLVRAPRGTHTVRASVPRRLPRGRYSFSVRGAIMDGPVSGTVRIGRR